MKQNTENVYEKVNELMKTLVQHNGFGDLKVEIKILSKGQKEIIVYCGQQYRFVVDFDPQEKNMESKQKKNKEVKL